MAITLPMRWRPMRWRPTRARPMHARPLRPRLGFECLERRELLAVVRLAAWNTFNGPNDLPAEADFATVLSAIGTETVAGIAKRIDILAIQETDFQGAGGGSIGRIEKVLDTLYATTSYAAVASNADGGGDRTGFVYDTSTVALLDSTTVAAGPLTHTILRAKFRPYGSMGESDFIVYSVHLKSGNSSSDELQRGLEASLLRSDADLLGEAAPVLFVGDFNMHDSFESAFTNLVASGAGKVRDVAQTPGDWSDNVAFTKLHTQNPRDRMNDRFDLQFASDEFFDGIGIDYVKDSFRVFGNDGSHTLDGAITTGSGAALPVLSALVSASDHLPIVADYETNSVIPLVLISEIMFNPDSEESEPGIAEWIEIVNTGSTPIDVGGWRFHDEDTTAWGAVPQTTILEASQVAVFFDEEFTGASSFRSEWLVPSWAQVIGIPWGSLANSPSDTNEILELIDSTGAAIDLVNFDDVSPWPSDSPQGSSIYLTDLLADNNDGSQWARSQQAVGEARSPTGPLFSALDMGSPGSVPASADFDGDGGIDGHDFFRWQRGFGIPVAAKSDGDADDDWDVDSADLDIWRASFGAGRTPSTAGSARSAMRSFLGPSYWERPAAGKKPVDFRLTADLVDIAFAREWSGAEASKAAAIVIENGVSIESAWNAHDYTMQRRLTTFIGAELDEPVTRSDLDNDMDGASIAGKSWTWLLSWKTNALSSLAS